LELFRLPNIGCNLYFLAAQARYSHMVCMYVLHPMLSMKEIEKCGWYNWSTPKSLCYKDYIFLYDIGDLNIFTQYSQT